MRWPSLVLLPAIAVLVAAVATPERSSTPAQPALDMRPGLAFALRAQTEFEPDDPTVHLRKRVEWATEEHDFAAAEEALLELQAQLPHDVWAGLLMSDVLVEQGRLDEAEVELQRVLNLKPCGAAYLRAAYVLHLRGQSAEAQRVVDLALDAFDPHDGDTLAWALTEQGNLRWHAGDVAGAKTSFAAALARDSDHAPALVGLGRIAVAEGDLERAAQHLAGSAGTPAQLSELAAVCVARGEHARAARILERTRSMVDRDPLHWSRSWATAVADHARSPGLDTERAVMLARDELARRSDVHGHDALSWALTANGEFALALEHAEKALALGTEEPLIYFHAGMAAAGAGQHSRGRRWLERALELNPHFHVSFPAQARATLLTMTEEGDA